MLTSLELEEMIQNAHQLKTIKVPEGLALINVVH
jgi:hypothetical protein